MKQKIYEVYERSFWQKHRTLICSLILAFFAICVLYVTLYDHFNPLIDPRAPSEVIKKVEAKETPWCFDAITCIRDIGEQVGASNKDILKAIRIARCESGFDQYAKNPSSTAKGIYQFIDGTWRSNCLKDGNVYDFQDNIKCFWKVYLKQGDRPWAASKRCWNK